MVQVAKRFKLANYALSRRASPELERQKAKANDLPVPQRCRKRSQSDESTYYWPTPNVPKLLSFSRNVHPYTINHSHRAGTTVCPLFLDLIHAAGQR